MQIENGVLIKCDPEDIIDGTVTISDNVTSIGPGAFRGCTDLRLIKIPAACKSIEACAFADCTSLISIAIPGSVSWIGPWAFSRCTSIEHIIIDASTANALDANGCTLLDRVMLSAPPPNLIKVMIFLGAYFTENELLAIGNANLKRKVLSWLREYQRAQLYMHAFEFFYTHACEQAGLAPPNNISMLPIGIWGKILHLDDISHPDYRYLTKRDLQDIRQQLEIESDAYGARAYKAAKQSVLYGYNETLSCLSKLGRQQVDEARLHDWKQAGGSTAMMLHRPNIC